MIDFLVMSKNVSVALEVPLSVYDFRSRNFYTIEQLKNLYNVSLNDFLKYHNIVSNIKSDWKRKLKHEDVRNLPLTLCILTQEKQSITLD